MVMQRDTRLILVQFERSILYSLHRSARSRGLQAGRERELVPGLYEERGELLEKLISSVGVTACVRLPRELVGA